MNSFHILPDDTVIICVKTCGQKWECKCSSVDLWMVTQRGDAHVHGLVPEAMPSHLRSVFLFTYCELVTALIRKRVFPWGDADGADEWRSNWIRDNIK